MPRQSGETVGRIANVQHSLIAGSPSGHEAT